MSARRERVSLALDGSAFVAAAWKAAHAIRRLGRDLSRLDYSRGDRHIERIIRDSAARRLPVDVTARRLMVASDIAAVLDERSAS